MAVIAWRSATRPAGSWCVTLRTGQGPHWRSARMRGGGSPPRRGNPARPENRHQWRPVTREGGGAFKVFPPAPGHAHFSRNSRAHSAGTSGGWAVLVLSGPCARGQGHPARDFRISRWRVPRRASRRAVPLVCAVGGEEGAGRRASRHGWCLAARGGRLLLQRPGLLQCRPGLLRWPGLLLLCRPRRLLLRWPGRLLRWPAGDRSGK
jgi:hypothetical protein